MYSFYTKQLNQCILRYGSYFQLIQEMVLTAEHEIQGELLPPYISYQSPPP